MVASWKFLGFYNPRTEPSTIEVKEDRLFDWMSKGAQPSESVVQLLNSVGAMDRFARFKAGESMETLLAEATAAYEKRSVNRRHACRKQITTGVSA